MIRKMSDREHVLQRPSMYIGAVNTTKSQEYILEYGKIQYKEISYVPGLIKIINEIIDNSVDVAIKTDFKDCTTISVKMTEEFVQVQDNGSGIPVQINSDGQQLAELAFGHSRAGSNFDDDENRTHIGMNGVGSFATNCFSKKFIGKTDDGKKSYQIIFVNNAESFTDKVDISKNKGVNVKFWPDLDKFGLTIIDEIHTNIIKQRLINLSMSFPKITFKFNGKKINVDSFKKYIQLFSTHSEIYENDDYKFAILPNNEDDFRQFSYVNGLKIPDGGTHIDIISNNVVFRLRDKLVKKFKTIKPGDIKNKLIIVAFLKNVKNTKFNSQSKEKITNSTSEINSYFGEIPFDQIVNKIFKNKEIIDPITEVYRIKEEFKRRQELKGLSKNVKRIKSDKYLPSIGTKKYLMLCEGACLDESTELLMADYSKKKIKDVKIGDRIISGDLSNQTVQGKTKLLKESITITTASEKITCGKYHKLKVYDIERRVFIFETAEHIKDNPKRFKLVKSKINSDTRYLEVKDNNNFIITLEDATEGQISYTIDDNFIIIRNSNVQRINGVKIKETDIILMS
jgi:DNA topoisomerase-2